MRASLLVGTILHVLYTEENKTLARVADLLSDPDRPIVEVFEMMAATNHLGDRPSSRRSSALLSPS